MRYPAGLVSAVIAVTVLLVVPVAAQEVKHYRFAYDQPTPYDIVSDGTSMVVRDRKLNTQDVYPLSQTPLRYLLSDRIDLLKDTNVVGIAAGEYAPGAVPGRGPLAGVDRERGFQDRVRLRSLLRLRCGTSRAFHVLRERRLAAAALVVADHDDAWAAVFLRRLRTQHAALSHSRRRTRRTLRGRRNCPKHGLTVC